MNCQLKLKQEILIELRQSDIMFRKRYLLLNILIVLPAEAISRTVKFQPQCLQQIKLPALFLCNILSGFSCEVGANG